MEPRRLQQRKVSMPRSSQSRPETIFRSLGIKLWQSIDGRRLRHTIYSLIGCPPVEAGTYILARRGQEGSLRVLAIRRTRSRVPSVNLASIRRTGARLGANEVHLCRLALTDSERKKLVANLKSAQPRVVGRRSPPTGRRRGRKPARASRLVN